jgi:5-carboxymethyl-2-hydroxymuconate isomerase
MPHCVIEYSNNLSEILDFKSIMHDLNQSILNSNLFDEAAIKIRALKYDEYLLHNKYQCLLHVRLHMLEGRTEIQKENLAKSIQACLVKRIGELAVSLTVEICDIHQASYQKL